jgi:hypothetical protein
MFDRVAQWHVGQDLRIRLNAMLAGESHKQRSVGSTCDDRLPMIGICRALSACARATALGTSIRHLADRLRIHHRASRQRDRTGAAGAGDRAVAWTQERLSAFAPPSQRIQRITRSIDRQHRFVPPIRSADPINPEENP